MKIKLIVGKIKTKKVLKVQVSTVFMYYSFFQTLNKDDYDFE